MGAADHSEADERPGDLTTQSTEAPVVDRSHNRDTLSSEAMTEMLRDVQDAMLALDERLAALESAQGAASHDTSLLARGVVDLGDALTRRVRALERVGRDPPSMLVQRDPAPPAKRPPPTQHRLPWIAALAFVLVIVLGTFWLLAAESLDHATDGARARPRVLAAPTPAPPPPPAVAVTTPVSPPPTHAASHTVTALHRPTTARKTFYHSLPAPSETTAPTGFGHYGPSASTPPPASAPASAPPRPPS